MPYQHGVRVLEQDTSVVTPVRGTAGLQVVFGTAPVNMAADPTAAVNTPVIAYSFEEAVEKLGYSSDFASYTLCEAMYASFKLYNVSPVIFVNVLDPATHKEALTAETVSVKNLRAVWNKTGVLLSTVVVKKSSSSETALEPGTDYALSFDASGNLRIDLLPGGSAASSTSVYVAADAIKPSLVTAANVIGATTGSTETGLEVLRQVYPKFGMVPGLIIAPGWSQDADVAAAIAAKCEEINGYFSCEGFVDIDCTVDGCTDYTDLLDAKETAGISSPHIMALWPKVKVGDLILNASAVWAALTQRLDADNDDVPNLSPSNKLLGISAAVLADGTEVLLDQVQASTINGWGISTALNVNGWRSWGNNSVAYPDTTDPKDRWFCCRRFFSWWGNTFIQTYFDVVDDPANARLIESVVDGENMRGNAYVAAGKCAAARIEYNESENDAAALLDGRLTFHMFLAPYTPAEDIVCTLEFDADALAAALSVGGES